MTRARCVRSDAVRAAAVVLLLTAVFAAGCVTPVPEPAVQSPPPTQPPAADTGSGTRVARVTTLRVGLPAPGRGNLLFNCDAGSVTPRTGSTDSTGALAPDTLFSADGHVIVIVVRSFDEATDEEIALERGEVDAAVFWPGELSARIRADTRFHDPETGGLRSRGVLVCVGGAGDTLGPPVDDMDALNREAFGGDLLPWSALEPGPDQGAPARYTVDRTVPGAKHLERILARAARPGGSRTLKLVYLDELVMAGGAAWAAWRTPGMTALFAIRCPVLARPESRATVTAIGTRYFAELAPCAGGTKQ